MIGVFIVLVLGASIGVPLLLRGVGSSSTPPKSVNSKVKTVVVHSPPPPSALVCLEPTTPNSQCFAVAEQNGFLDVTLMCGACTMDSSTSFTLTSGLVVCRFAYCLSNAPSPPPSPPPCADQGLSENNSTGANNTIRGCGNTVVGSDVTVIGNNNNLQDVYSTKVVGNHNELLYVTSDSIYGEHNVVQSSKQDVIKGSRNRVADTASQGNNKIYGSSDTIYNDTSDQVFGVDNITVVGQVSQLQF